ncbi:putative neurogenic locus notch like protein 2 [Calycina marina]|uniref:Neurogenic locus notch like protein 2 n=1 Tax=Calycina marina TaxID=1763456 RepID=A0A9P7Z925_9HELO|nr:putative neurogenic locus notch like protein 2 [Calycina marina]
MSTTEIEKAGKYPIVLSDALLGKASKETYTRIQYSHKPNASSLSDSGFLNLSPSKSGTNFDLAPSDNSDSYTYNGKRTSENGQYVLIFDREQLHFVLHQVDSTFDMSLVDTSWEHDTATLKSQSDQLAHSTSPPSGTPVRRPAKAAKTAPAAKVMKAIPAPKAAKPAIAPRAEPKRRKSVQAKKKAPVREPTPEEDSDDGLTIEYPDASAPPQNYDYQPTPIFQRNDSEEISDEDAEGEDDEERNQDVDFLKLPSPSNNNAGGISDEELDLEAELEEALKEEGGADESSESEEE